MSFLAIWQKKAFRAFMDGRPGPWGALAAGIFGFRTLRRWSRRTEQIVYRGELEPGGSLVITHTNDTVVSLKKDRKAAKKAARRGRGSGADDS